MLKVSTRRKSSNSIKDFLLSQTQTNAAENIKVSLKLFPTSRPDVKIDPIDKSDFIDYSISNKSHVNYIRNKKIPAFGDPNRLPEQPTDIKGVDDKAHALLFRNRISKPMPTLLSNEFFTLMFFPSNHYVSSYRKSNISYTFTNFGTHKLNSVGLEKALNSYKGKFRSSTYFQQNLQPFSTAVGRSSYRKFVKQCLFQSLQKSVTSKQMVHKVAGIYRFKFSKVPVTEEERLQVHKDLDNAINKVLNDNLYNSLLVNGTQKSNQAKQEIAGIKTGISKESSTSWKVPDFFPRLPFMKQTIKTKPNSKKPRK
ncbi:uncharacterized protein RJT20DRAFT_34117 [Scheffersomyces xylosifermentans]|uniref:uncharacterized protein n=1 Tax=Scheffersomyces xylosifermentans TaxID=1304137 RepID=UPI00315C5865